MSEMVLHDVSGREDGGGKDNGSKSRGVLSSFSLGCFCERQKECQYASEDKTKTLTEFSLRCDNDIPIIHTEKGKMEDIDIEERTHTPILRTRCTTK